MSLMLKILLFIIAPIIGCLLAGLERKLSGRLQHRVGPPLLQPLYDVLKLFNKENVVVNKYQNLFIYSYLIFVVLSLLLLILGFDLLMIIFVFTIANISFIVGSMSTGSPYARLGGQRETMAMLAYEPILIIYIIGIYMLTGSFNVSSLQSWNKPIILYLPLIFISMLFIMIIKFKKSPFDFSSSHEAHQELVKGMTTEYSGPALAIIEITHWFEYIFLLGLMFLFSSNNIFGGILISMGTFLFTIVIDNISARVNWQWMLKFSWTAVLSLSVVNILAIYLLKTNII
jgi:ech hydrogenase subunit B